MKTSKPRIYTNKLEMGRQKICRIMDAILGSSATVMSFLSIGFSYDVAGDLAFWIRIINLHL